MKRKKPINTHCLNCESAFESNHHVFCPNCGQRREGRLTLGNIFENLLSSYFSLDSRLLNTFAPFLFEPGKVTKDYINGKRTKYLSPSQMYFFFSFVLLLLITSFFMKNWEQKVIQFISSENTNASIAFGDERMPLITEIQDSVKNQLQQEKINIPNGDETTALEGLEYAAMEVEEINQEVLLLIQEGKGNEEIYVTVTPVEERSRIDKTVNYFYYNILRNKGKGFLVSVISQLTLGTLVFMFLFTLLLSLLYVRRKFSIPEHFVHTVYLFAFLFVLSLFGLVGIALWPNYFWQAFIPLSGLTYLFFSLKKVYGQSIGKTLLKYIMILIATVWFILPVVFGVVFLLSMIQYSK